ncbi:MAG: alanine--tRNA ligase [Burkholderiales bacterium]|nr:MAG: alanine--tRNA ligase [Burkholderiales bacterium]
MSNSTSLNPHLKPFVPAKKFSVAEIRESFIAYFEKQAHTAVASSPLVPGNDPTLMFTNSGMVQFKDVFLGEDKRPYVRAASVQACLRAGGKHNDLENVGYTARHHTFFEMLGNWSFGDYFKRESLKWGWELLTKVYGLPAERLLATVYIDDDEAYDIWTKEIGLPPERVVRIGDNKGGKYKSDNFWMMADTGPCGPCSEIFFDHGPHIPGGPPGSPDEDGDRFIEIWNHVFMQFNMAEDGSITKLPAPCVDTGMGLERLAAILQGVHSNYEIDLFQKLIAAASREVFGKDVPVDLNNPSLRVIADHIRATSFLVADGVVPSNEGRGYVQRRIVRRAIRHGYKLGRKTPFFHKIVPDLVALMGDAYPHLKANAQRVMDVLKVEEERFYETLATGMEILDGAIDEAQIQGQKLKDGFPLDVAIQKGTLASHDLPSYACYSVEHNGKYRTYVLYADENELEALSNLEGMQVIRRKSSGLTLTGNIAFRLHDTYGFPLDLTNDVCRERDVNVDEAGFNKAMEQQKNQARAAGKFKMDKALEYSGALNTFVGYEKLEATAKVIALYAEGTPANELKAGQNGIVVLDSTPFYAESGGQAGDEGLLHGSNGAIFATLDTQKIKADVFGHHGNVHTGSIKVGDTVTANVNAEARNRTVRNHSATHLMHEALRVVLGTHVQQKGSEVTADRTRFDFTHNAPVTDAQISEIERRVNAEILSNQGTNARVMAIDDAKATGAMMLFGEKYGEQVRVLSIGNSTELCGGTHVKATGDIGLFKIVAESGVAAGVRRVEAVTGQGALEFVQHLEATLSKAAAALKATPDDLAARIGGLQDQVKALEKELAQAKGKLASNQGDELVNQAIDIKGIKVLAAKLEGADAKALRDTMDKLKDKLKTAVIVLAAADGDKVQIAAGVTADTLAKVKAGDLVNFVAGQVGGKGGGKPDMAMAGGTDASKLGEALASVQGWVSGKL